MKSRRSFLKAFLTLVVTPATLALDRIMPARATTQDFHVVNGWIVTDHDLEVLKKHA